MNDIGFSTLGTRALLDQNPVVGEAKRGGRRFWTNKELRTIRELYPTGGLAACLPHLPGRSTSSIYQQALEMGVKRVNDDGKPREKPSYPPTPALDQAICDLYRDGPTNEGLKNLCRLTGRPRRWFTDRAAVLGLVTPRFREAPWSDAELAILEEKSALHPGSVRMALRKAGFARSIAGIVMQLKRRGWRRGKADGRYSKQMLTATDPVEVLGEKYRRGVLDVVLAVLDTPEFKAASVEERLAAELAGLMLGFCAAVQSMSRPEGHAELRSLIIEHLPTYFDDAREGGGMPRLGSARTDLTHDSYLLQHRLQSVIGGMEANEAVNGLTNVLTVLMLTSCATKEDAKRSALMVGETIRGRVLERWSDPDYAETRRKLQAEAKGRMN